MKNVPKPTYFGKNLKFLRKFKGLTQGKLGESLELKRSRIASYELGNVEPSAKEFLKIARFFEISPQLMAEKLIDVDLTDHLFRHTTETDLEETLLNEELADFIYYTNEASKVKEGYDILNKLKQLDEHKEYSLLAYSQMEDLLLIMSKLLEANWKLIHAISK